jgi:hypothetical protein
MRILVRRRKQNRKLWRKIESKKERERESRGWGKGGAISF